MYTAGIGVTWVLFGMWAHVHCRYRQDGAFCNDPSLYVRLNVYIYTHMYIDWLWACEMCECGAMLFACSLQKMSTYSQHPVYVTIYRSMCACTYVM